MDSNSFTKMTILDLFCISWKVEVDLQNFHDNLIVSTLLGL